MDKVLVTGGAGYIGSHCVKELLQRGYQVVVVDNLACGHRQAVPTQAYLECQDLQDRQALLQVFRQQGPFAAVMHFAAFIEVDRSLREPLAFYQNNVANTINVLQSMAEAKVPHFIFSSSAAVYGEPCYTPIDENHPLTPVNPYGWSKRMVEAMLRDCARAYGISFCALRYFNAAGADPDGTIGEDHNPETHLIPRILKVALKVMAGQEAEPLAIFGNDYATPDGTCIRDYVHVQDLSQAHVLSLDYLKAGGDSQAFNIGTGSGYSVREVVNTVRSVTGIDIPVRELSRRAGDPSVLVASSEKIRRMLGWQPQYPGLSDIIAHAWNWHKRNPYGFAG